MRWFIGSIGLVGCAVEHEGRGDPAVDPVHDPTVDEDDDSPADPATVLIDLATEVYDVVMWDVIAALGDPLWEMTGGPEGATLSGTLHLPEDAGGDATLDGELTIDWTVRYDSEPFAIDPEDRVHFWTYGMDVQIDRLALPSAEVSGTARWEVTEEKYDYTLFQHDWSGTLSIDGAAPVDVDWRVPTGEGTIDGQDVDWTPSLDVP